MTLPLEISTAQLPFATKLAPKSMFLCVNRNLIRYGFRAGKNNIRYSVNITFHRGGSRIFFRRGCTRLLLYFNTNKPHSFFFGRISVALENRRSSQGEGGAHPLHPPPRSTPVSNDYWMWHFFITQFHSHGLHDGGKSKEVTKKTNVKSQASLSKSSRTRTGQKNERRLWRAAKYDSELRGNPREDKTRAAADRYKLHPKSERFHSE